MNIKNLRSDFENMMGTDYLEHDSQRNDKGLYKNLTLRKKWSTWFACARRYEIIETDNPNE